MASPTPTITHAAPRIPSTGACSFAVTGLLLVLTDDACSNGSGEGTAPQDILQRPNITCRRQLRCARIWRTHAPVPPHPEGRLPRYGIQVRPGKVVCKVRDGRRRVRVAPAVALGIALGLMRRVHVHDS